MCNYTSKQGKITCLSKSLNLITIVHYAKNRIFARFKKTQKSTHNPMVIITLNPLLFLNLDLFSFLQDKLFN